MDLGLGGRRAFVTGGAGGIGQAVTRFLRYEGCHVAAGDLAPAPDHHRADLWLTLDVTDEDSVRDAVAAASTQFGGLDLVVGCAGVDGPRGAVPDTPLDAWQQTLAVNLTGQFLLAKHAIPFLRASAEAQREPAIVFVAADSAFVATPGTAAYCASHGGLLMLTKALAVDHGPEGIRVNCVAPSIVRAPTGPDLAPDTASAADTDTAPGDSDRKDPPYPVHTPADIARSIVLLASGVTSTINGTALVMDFGGLALSSFEA